VNVARCGIAVRIGNRLGRGFTAQPLYAQWGILGRSLVKR